MIQIIPSEKRHVQKMGWLDVYSIFSCNNYFDPWNTHFSNLIALNEYIIQPGFGFDMHPHEDIEQIFLLMEGELSYADSLGNKGVLVPGDIQAISAGRGYARHAYNKSDTPCRYLAIWLIPHTLRLPPSYMDTSFSKNSFASIPIPIVSGDACLLGQFHEYPLLEIHSNATLFKMRLNASEHFERITEKEKEFIYISEGIVHCNNETICRGGHIRVEGKEKLRFFSDHLAEIIIISMWKHSS